MFVVVENHVREIQLDLRPFHRLEGGQHEVYKRSRTLNVTVHMSPDHLFKDMEPGSFA